MAQEATKGYMVTFNDHTDDEETGGISSWSEGQLAFSRDIGSMVVIYNGAWEIVAQQTA